MPTGIPGAQDQYYDHQSPVSHHRQRSSHSAIREHESYQSHPRPTDDAGKPPALLPSTTYHSSESRARTPSLTINNLSRLDTSIPFPSIHDPSHDLKYTVHQDRSANPDDFYRPYPATANQASLSPANLHQDALRTLNSTIQRDRSHSHSQSQSRAGSNGSYSTNWSFDDPRDTALPPRVPGLKQRKSSVKNLVAQINASSTADQPPIPNQPLPNTYKVPSSSTYLSSAHISHFSGVRKPSKPAAGRTSTANSRSSSIGPRMSNLSTQDRPPLFGEVLTNERTLDNVGYGITNPRRRAGSESSPMHSPSPMFPPDQRDSQFVLSPAVYTKSNNLPEHHRSSSDLVLNTTRDGFLTSPASTRRPPATSRIPVSNRRMSAASDSGNSAPSSRAPSALDHLLFRYASRGLPEQRIEPALTTQPRPSIGRITSPGRRGKPVASNPSPLPQGAKSPSLRANIIVPPPKKSPPLRSSRPRLPVSSASTAASRARMAEKFTAQQKIINEKKAAQQRRGKPPELTDIDFNARRLKITQAITRSRESEDLHARHSSEKRPISRSVSLSPRPESLVSEDLSSVRGSYQMPIIDDYDDRSPDTSTVLEHREATQTALKVVHDDTRAANEDIDSPTLGHHIRSFEKPNVHLQTQFLNVPRHYEPQSAATDATADTEATHIDPEPQEDADGNSSSLLTHVRQMRMDSPSDETFAYSPQSKDDERHDRADVVSVNLVLRNTAYLDDDEAVRKGYRTNFDSSEPLPKESEEHKSVRDSWTSLMHEELEHDDEHGNPELSEQYPDAVESQFDSDSRRPYPSYQESTSDYRDTMASDAYTMINIVLQERSSSGIVDQQFADDIYRKVLEVCPEMEDEGMYDTVKIEQLCLAELSRRDEAELPEPTEDSHQMHRDRSATQMQEQHMLVEENTQVLPQPDPNLLTLPRVTYANHKHKSSLDSVEDWASTSPSIGDWIRFAAEPITPPTEATNTGLSPMQDRVKENGVTHEEVSFNDQPKINHSDATSAAQDMQYRGLHDEEPEEYGIAIIRAPNHSPPPPPKDYRPSIEQMSRSPILSPVNSEARKPRVPYRIGSLGQTQTLPRASHSSSRAPSVRSRAEVTPWEVQDQPLDTLSPEAQLLKRRKYIIGELVDTEFTYQRDMRVLCDIYKQTAPAALTEDDIRVLFGNVEQVQRFAKDFLTALRQTTKSLLVVDRKKDRISSTGSLAARISSSPTFASNTIESEVPDIERDRDTRIGEAFEGSLLDMEVVYAEYIRNQQAANQRLEILQKQPAAQEWLKECRDNSTDITHAWNLDALLVKPVQRLTKYPLLLRQLLDATPEHHPDYKKLERMEESVTNINVRINDVKKHAEMLDQAFNRRRGQSDVRTGLSKAFGRKAEKLRQHVGITDMYEDSEYDRLRVQYDNNHVQLVVIKEDCALYEKGISQWVSKMVDIAAAAEAWVDVGHSHHQQEESKLRHLAGIIRNIHLIALPDHIEHLHAKVIKPMGTTVDILQKFKDDPKGLLQKRDKRLVDYAQMKNNKKEKADKIDKKSAERMEQWEALNTEAKDRMRKLLRATAHLVQSCQGHLVHLQMSWMFMIQEKFSRVMGIDLRRLSIQEIERDWQEDFDFQEASALALGLCNGSLMLQAANMTSFLTPSTTLNGEDSPRQMSTSSINNKRSISVHSESSFAPILDSTSRPSATYNQAIPDHFDRPYPYPNGRIRAASTTSGKSTKRPEMTSRTSANTKHTSAAANFARVAPSPIVQQDLFAPPRLSVETHSPLMNSFQIPNGAERPVSSSTFFSAAAAPSNTQVLQHSRGTSGIFSSALPLSDSPEQERQLSDGLFDDPQTLFTAASVYEFNIDRSRREAGFPYLTYVTGEIFDVLGERGELWLAKNQDDPQRQIGWIWNKHFAKLAE